MLSDVDIIKELGKNLEIYPLIKDNIKGGSVNFTASKMAWSVLTKNTAYDEMNNEIIIDCNDTTLILTEEIFAVSEKIAGTFHSRVAEASEGLGHISTVINPGWCGRPLIAVNNRTNNKITIKVGEPFVIMILEYLHTPSSIKIDSRKTSRFDILHNYNLNSSERKKIYEDDFQNINDLKRFTKENKVYEDVKKTRAKKINIKKYFQIVVALASAVFIIYLTYKNLGVWNTIPTIIFTTIAYNLFQNRHEE